MCRLCGVAGLLVAMLLVVAGFAAPALAAAGMTAEPVSDWVPARSLPPELVSGSLPRVDNLVRLTWEQVAASLGRPYRAMAAIGEATVFTRDAAGRYGFVLGMEVGVVFGGTDAEANRAAAQGKFDQVRYARVAGQAENGVWHISSIKVLETPALPVPALPGGGALTQGERVRGWLIPFTGAEPKPPIGSGLNLSDIEPLRALSEELASYPAEAIAGIGPQDPDFVISTELQAAGAVVAGLETDALLVVRTVNVYRRAPWMDGVWKGSYRISTNGLDSAARAAGVTPDQVFAQRILAKRTATGWAIAEMQIGPGPYLLTVIPPTYADRVIGALGTVKVHVPSDLRRDPEPMDTAAAAAAAAGATLILGAWAGVQVMSTTSQTVKLAASVTDETTGSQVTKLATSGIDWLFRPLERPLAQMVRLLGRRVGLFEHLAAEAVEHREMALPAAHTAARVPGKDGRFVCGACGRRIGDTWRHCTACGAELKAPRSAAGGESL